ncbi:hypothetical protein POM88_012831 [Heracleum sosnowskyi]|uniref:RNase H type-1 domain-containing protein n=1 Tax=Heracleum sosnowskyi TaxID=360622 RepID=A0AAD8J121_9APIA|nr:hypothetical protein POM88_012831 [Heracleum sosnowskyi]
MNIQCFPPPQGTVKVNVHGGVSSFPFPAENASVLGDVLRDEEGSLRCGLFGAIKNMTSGVIGLWAIFKGMCLAFQQGFRNVHSETNNLQAFYHVNNFRDGVPEQLHDLVQQIDMMRRDPRWTISIFLIYPRRNTIEIYLAHLGGQLERLYLLDTILVGNLDEYLAMDMDLIGDMNVGFNHIGNEDEVVENFPMAGEILPGGAGIVEIHHVILEDEIIGA